MLSYCSKRVIFCCLIVVPLPPGENPFAVNNNNNNNNLSYLLYIMPDDGRVRTETCSSKQ
jgi:hypothetical protein